MFCFLYSFFRSLFFFWKCIGVFNGLLVLFCLRFFEEKGGDDLYLKLVVRKFELGVYRVTGGFIGEGSFYIGGDIVCLVFWSLLSG